MEIANNLYKIFYKDQTVNCIKQLSDNQILNIANDINSLFSETNLAETKFELTLPRLVVVGTQSSGKSSVLNAIMTMDILPTGKNMVTRTPLDIRLFKLKESQNDIGWIEFGHYKDGDWMKEEKINIKVPIPNQDEITKIRNFITKKTTELAGEGMNISPTPIIIKIYSPYVPNLSLVDLPGLTMVACVDKGQPIDIKDRIENLVSSYIKQNRTIIIAVMQSRSDLETDLGLALIKKHDTDGQRTIGVLTKPDLMNYETHIGEYLTNNISKNLMLAYGYYVLRNRSDKETKEMDILKGFEMEKAYFSNHYEYKKPIYKDKVGIQNLTNNLSKILISSISEMIPSVMTEIISLETKVNKKLEKMGESLPTTKEGKINILNKYVSNYYYRFFDSIESRGTVLNTGKMIKDIFVEYRKELHNIHPFLSNKIYDESYFKNISSSFEGNHMSFYIPPIQILEACMTDEKLKPILSLRERSTRCVDDICKTIIDLFKSISQQEEFMQYPSLASFIMSVIIDEVITPLKIKAKQQIIDIIKFEEDYIWTDSKEFATVLLNLTKDNKFDQDSIKKMLESYFTAIKDIVAHIVPKIIMSEIVRKMEKTLLSYMFQKIVTEDKITLLKEDDDIDKQRKYYIELRSRIESIKKIFSKYMIINP